jgi:tyrocidine synthetase-3
MKESVLYSISKTGYWREKLEKVTKTVPFSTKTYTPKVIEEIKVAAIPFPEGLSNLILEKSKGKDINIYKLFITAISIVLAKYNAQKDVLITTSTINLEDGLRTNNPLLTFFKVNVDDQNTVKRILNNTHKELLEVIENQDYHYEEFKSEVLSNKETSAKALGTGVFYENINIWTDKLKELTCLFRISRKENKLICNIDYNGSVYDEVTINFFGIHISQALQLCLENFDTLVSKLNFITDRDKDYIAGDILNNEENKLVILDGEDNLQPIGVYGTVFSTTTNTANLTIKKNHFVDNLFNNKWYVTEKVARKLPNNNIEFLVTKDNKEVVWEEKSQEKKEFELPRNNEEQKLHDLWRNLLSREKINVHDNFFKIGGHSLKATQLVARIRQSFNVKLSLKDIFNAPVLSDLAKLIASKTSDITFNSITKAPFQQFYDLSHSQKRMWILNKISDNKANYNIPHAIKLIGNVEIKTLNKAIQTLINKHEILRTKFVEINQEPKQQILYDYEYQLSFVDVSLKKNAEGEAKEIAHKEAIQVFDLDKKPPFSVKLLRTKQKEHVFLFTLHHIISDGWSTRVFSEEIIKNYELIKENGHIVDEYLKIQYKDYAFWQNKMLNRSESNSLKRYWKTKFSEEITELKLPLDKPRLNTTSPKGATQSLQLNSKLNTVIKAYALTKNTTPFFVLMSLVKLLLHRYTEQKDIIVGTPVSGRDFIELENQIGFYVNTLAVRSNIQSNFSFNEVLLEVKNNLLEAYQHQLYPFDKLVEDLNLKPSPNRNPIFDVMVMMEENQNSEEGLKTNYFEVAEFEQNHENDKFDLLFGFNENQETNKLIVTIEYATNLFEATKISKMLCHFEQITEICIGNPDVKIGSFNYLTEKENLQLQSFNGRVSINKQWKSIINEFVHQVYKNPNRIALVDDTKSYTYLELHEKTNQIANYLLSEYNIKRDEVVAIFCDRTVSYVCAILGVLKAGGAYLPLEKSQPKEYIDELLKTTKSRFLIVDKIEEETNWNERVSCISLEQQLLKNNSKEFLNINVNTGLSSLACVMFTSGTTGKPKGVEITNQGILKLVKDVDFVNFSSGDKMLQTGSLSFDAATFEIWGMLLNGGELHFVKMNNLLDVTSLSETIKKREINKVFFTTSWFNQLVDIDVNLFSSIKHVMTGGEKLSPSHALKLKMAFPALKFTNCYGPTENTTMATTTDIEISDLENIPIGCPVKNTTVYILDTNYQSVPIGVTGELFIGGLGLSTGYINDEEKTKEKFIKIETVNEPYLYKTGDLGRWENDGRITFYGRTDDQVKIRGHRIELSGIITVAQNHPLVKEVEVLVLKLKESKDKVLVLYYTCQKELSDDDLKDFIKEDLPSYMIPSFCIELDQIPLKNNGKVDRKKLPTPELANLLSNEYSSPVTAIEKELVAIISNLLELNENKISITANFFELGIHSLKAIALVNKIKVALKTEVPYSKIFTFNSIEELANYIQGNNNFIEETIEASPIMEMYPASSSQKRLYTLFKMQPDSLAYNIPEVIELPKKYSKEQIAIAFNKLIERHESLRTKFMMENGEVFQKIEKNRKLVIKEIKEDSIDIALQKFVTPFDLEKEILVRVAFVKKENTLLLDIHHIITDGRSQEILGEELLELLEGTVLTQVPCQFKDYSYWIQQPRQQEKLKTQRSYWKHRLSKEIPDLKLPLDFERSTHQNFTGKTVQFKLASENVAFLKELSKKHETTLYTTLISVWSVLLSKLGAVEDVVIGTPVLGRNSESIMNTVGMFVNTVPVRLQPKGNQTFIDYLKQVKQHTLKDFENQEYPLDEIINTIDCKIDVSRNPLFDTMFGIVNDGKVSIETINKKGIFSEKSAGVKFDLNFKVINLEDEIVCSLDYKTSLFKEKTIQEIVERFHQFLNVFRKNSNIQLNLVDALLPSELEEIVEKINDTAIIFENRNKTIDQLFSENAIKFPNKLGLADANKKLTLTELEEKVTLLASHIVEKGAANSLIAIYMEPSVDVIISILAIFKSGSAYVPIDTELPSERIEHILQDSGAKCIILSKNYQKDINFTETCIDIEDEASWTFKSKLEQSLSSSEKLAYIIYTSGSTGKPKGVRIAQYQLGNYVQWFTKKLNYSYKDSAVLLSSFAFDLGHSTVFTTIANGGALHMLKKEEYLDIDYLNTYLKKEKITFIKGTPTLFSLIINDPYFEPNALVYLRYLMLGGEEIIYKDLTTYFNYYPDKKVINHYGPTEATIGCIVKSLSKENYHEIKEASIIGRPISNMNAYILDNYLKPVAPGVLGQLYLSGIAISEGYHNRPDLTKEKFIEDPFDKEKRMYATGDLASWSTSYEIEFKGRIDDQLKIRGYRVELGEIKKVINTIDFVQKCCILIKEEKGQKSLVAFIETKEVEKIEVVRSLLEKSLPSYMIPNLIIPISKIPATPNGKTDKKALAKLIENLKQEEEKPTTNTEKLVLELWNVTLNIELNDISANFFSLGGNSLRALKLIGKIEQQFRKKISLKEFFSNPTIKKIAKKIDTIKEVSYVTIQPIEERAYYPLSHSQKRLWMLHEFSENKVAYNVPRVYELKGTLNTNAIVQAFEAVFKKHEILRTTFKEVHGEPQQFIKPINEFKNPLVIDDLKVNENNLESFITNISNLPFNLSEGPLVDARIYTKNTNEYILFINLHHIISDGWSATILLNELCEFYNAIIAGEEYNVSELPVQYKDYSVWQKQQFENEIFKEHKVFWENKLSGELTRFSLPTSYPKTMVNKGKSLRYVINKKLINKLELKTIELGASFYMLLLAAFKTLAYRYTLQNDIIIGTIVAGREKEELTNQLGFYVNTIAQRTYVNGEAPFIELLQTLKEDLLETVEHQHYPFDQVINDLGITEAANNSPLFDVVFVHQNNEELDDSVQLSGLEVVGLESDLNESKFDVSFVTRQTSEGLQIFIEYNAALYSEEFLQQFLKHYESILNCVEKNIETPINQLDYLGENKELLLNSFNDTFISKNYKNIHEIVEQKVLEQPNKTAIITKYLTLTYQELNQKANALANFIEEKYQPKQDDIIAFSIKRSEWQIVAMLAILKVGAAFLPIDCKQPESRKRLILEDAKPVVVIYDDSLSVETTNLNFEKLANIKELLSAYGTKNLGKTVDSKDLAYVIYTSGSTGKPKGVLIEHRGNINMVIDQIKQLGITKEDKCLQFASISFDASIYEVFISLYSGSTLVLTTDEIIENPLQFVDYITEKGVTFATLPPAYLSGLNKSKLTSLQTIVTAGESPNYIDAQYFSKKLNYFNAYGPTEYSVCATLYKVKGDEKVIPIGKPLQNTQIYILDTNMNLMPIGSWGEIHLAGDGLARGYINRPEKSKEVFVENPFKSAIKLYKTGDVGRWLNNGNIEFAYRSGDMIKIRGFRVEKGEIVSTLLMNSSIKKAVVTFNEKQQSLTAYIVNKHAISIEEVKVYLAEKLPAYMIPTFIIKIDKIPLTTNGKINYKKLEIISEGKKEILIETEFVHPENEIENRLLTIWRDVLETNPISTKDNFFEIGGQSITAMKLIGSIWNSFQKEIRLKDFLQNPTIKDLSNLLQNSCNKTQSLIVSFNETQNQIANLFMIPPVLGTSMIYRSLSESFSKAKIASYGIQYKGFDSDEILNISILDMVKDMVDEITTYLEKDKINIVLGYSMGALLAVEIVAEIEKKGYKTKLILIDKDPENSIIDVFPNNVFLEEESEIEEIVSNHLQELILPDFSKDRVTKLVRNNIKLLTNYKGFKGKIDSDILAIEASESVKRNKMIPWQKITNSNFSHSILSGNHYSILNKENQIQILQLVLEFINQKNQIL